MEACRAGSRSRIWPNDRPGNGRSPRRLRPLAKRSPTYNGRILIVHRVFWVSLALIVAFGPAAFAAEVIPPKPAKYFNDYANVVSPGTAQRLDNQLTQFERDTSNQVVVAIFPTMQTDSDIADYTRRVAQSWQVGQKETRNGAVLFVFVKDRKMFIQVGYGLEGALPDATAFDITEFRIKPHFRSNDYDGGLTEGVDSICKAIRGEYKGSGRTVAERNRNNGGKGNFFPLLFFFFLLLILLSRQKQRRCRYSGLGG